MEVTDTEKQQFLKVLAKECYDSGDSFYAHKLKKGDWVFGYTNDYPMQHGDGKEVRLPNKMVELLMKKLQ